MIFEDKDVDSLCFKTINSEYSLGHDIRFIVENSYINRYSFPFDKHIESPSNRNLYADDYPSIYSIPLPSGEKNVFQLSDVERIDVSSFDNYSCLSLFVIISNPRMWNDIKHNGSYYYDLKRQNSREITQTHEIIDISNYLKDPRCHSLMHKLLQKVIDYFNTPIGWK